jgi:hypothetical protein
MVGLTAFFVGVFFLWFIGTLFYLHDRGIQGIFEDGFSIWLKTEHGKKWEQEINEQMMTQMLTQNASLFAQYSCDVVAVMEDLVFIGEGSYRSVLDVSDLTSPALLGQACSEGITTTAKARVNGFSQVSSVELNMPNRAASALFVDSLEIIYVAGSQGGEFIDVADPTRPRFTIPPVLLENSQPIGAIGPYLYVADRGHFSAYNLADPLAPRLVGSSELPAAPYSLTGALSESLACLAGFGRSELIVVDISNPAAQKVVEEIQAWFKPSHISIADSTIVVANLNTSKIEIIDIFDPRRPGERAELKIANTISGMDALGDIVLIAAKQDGLYIVDVSDPAAPTILSHAFTPGEARGVAGSGLLAFVADGPAGLQILDISDPSNPTIICSYKMKNYNWSVTLDQNGKVIRQSP